MEVREIEERPLEGVSQRLRAVSSDFHAEIAEKSSFRSDSRAPKL